ncbi:hypothetical protein CIT292_09242 [Citrobacter youngae ATCC 29220]|uniref:Uncharacterized protein n=1 Tax=Citrobacter youngae ATCC 29220 TaxID=500640 RepID=D4BEM9_9ENTR|nr:hypothetical protein CIT292_09242 [Citrobacter youngae ATCC 29220]
MVTVSSNTIAANVMGLTTGYAISIGIFNFTIKNTLHSKKRDCHSFIAIPDGHIKPDLYLLRNNNITGLIY